MGDPSTGDPSMGVQATGVPPTHLARSSIQAWLPDGLIQKLIETMGGPASAKISASRYRCFLAFPDVRQSCSADLSSVIHSSSVQQR